MAEEWWPSKAVYDPNITKEEWGKLLRNEKVFNFNSMCMMRRFLDLGGEATCAELAEKYGKTDSSYNMASTQLARRILKSDKRIKQPPENLFPVLYFGRHVSKNDNHKGVYIWRLRDELKAALQEIDLSKYPLEEDNTEWKNLLKKYKTLMRENPKVAFDDEAYKWETITYAKGKTWKELLLYLLGKTSETKEASNLFFYTALNNAKLFLEDERLDSVLNSLCNEGEELRNRLGKFKSDINDLTSSFDKSYARPNDERSASVFLACKNPQSYTFYKPSYYESLCKYLNVDSEIAGNKYEHYLSLIDEFAPLVEGDSDIMAFYNEHTDGYISSLKLIAQNIIYVLFESGKSLVHERKYWIAKLSDEDYWEKAVNDCVWCAQQRYGLQTTSAVTNFLAQVKKVHKGDVLFLTYGNLIYAYGIVKEFTSEKAQVSSIAKTIENKVNEYNSGIVKFSESDVFYEDLRNGEDDWGQRINVEKWLCYNHDTQVSTEGVVSEITSGVVSLSLYGVSKEFGEKIMKNLERQAIENQPLERKLAKLLKATHNLILHGAPGTGKTYLARNKIAPALAAELGASGVEVGFVQFHPSYDYTDFVEGLRPVNDENNGQIGFERKDGVFKEFCLHALQNVIDSKKSIAEIGKEKSVDEKIEDFITNSIDTKREFRTVTGNEFYVTDSSDKNIYISIPANEKTDKLILQRNELSVLLNSDVKIDNGNDIRDFFGRKWRTQQDSYTLILYKEIKNSGTVVPLVKEVVKIELKPFVFIIDEINRGELSKIFGELFTAIDPDYRGTDGKVCTQYQNLIPAGDVFKKGFYVPENVYIIGTMNDIDRSVESMDLAMRRRFSFREITAEESAEEMLTKENDQLSDLDNEIIDEMKIRMTNLNSAIVSDEIGLSFAYQIGAAYFLKYNMYKKESKPFSCLWNYNLEPLLREYLRGQADMEDKMEKLKAAYDGNGASATAGAD